MRNRAFRDAYIAAREAFLAGVRDVVFPAGTYLAETFRPSDMRPLARDGLTAFDGSSQ
jgi:hypothetical protein